MHPALMVCFPTSPVLFSIHDTPTNSAVHLLPMCCIFCCMRYQNHASHVLICWKPQPSLSCDEACHLTGDWFPTWPFSCDQFSPEFQAPYSPLDFPAAPHDRCGLHSASTSHRWVVSLLVAVYYGTYPRRRRGARCQSEGIDSIATSFFLKSCIIVVPDIYYGSGLDIRGGRREAARFALSIPKTHAPPFGRSQLAICLVDSRRMTTSDCMYLFLITNPQIFGIDRLVHSRMIENYCIVASSSASGTRYSTSTSTIASSESASASRLTSKEPKIFAPSAMNESSSAETGSVKLVRAR